MFAFAFFDMTYLRCSSCGFASDAWLFIGDESDESSGLLTCPGCFEVGTEDGGEFEEFEQDD